MQNLGVFAAFFCPPVPYAIHPIESLGELTLLRGGFCRVLLGGGLLVFCAFLRWRFLPAGIGLGRGSRTGLLG
ncbi:MAG TPA: hypothetical protein VIF32_08360 [Gemmatimonadaceae bacterium]